MAIDIKDGVYVYATGGDRARYGPPKWLEDRQLTPSEGLCEITRRFGATQFYLADLDAIGGQTLQVLPRYRGIAQDVWIDLGVHSIPQWYSVSRQIDVPLILCTETVALEQWLPLTRLLRYDDIISLDYRGGQVVFADGCVEVGALGAVLQEIKLSTRVLFLDLERVGSNRGPKWDVIEEIRRLHPRVWIGGGIRDASDVSVAQWLHLEGIVAATAVFNGSIPVKMPPVSF